MGKKISTDIGKSELLRLGFTSEEEGGAFKFLALGKSSSTGAQDGNFDEIGIGDSGYSRVETTSTIDGKTINITGTFSEENYAPNVPTVIKEIGLCNTEDRGSSGEKFFLYSEVPAIEKTNDISLEYTIILSID